MTCNDNGGKLRGGKVLHFVNEQSDRGTSIRRRFRHRNQDARQVLLQIAGIPLTGREVHAELQITGRHLECPGEVDQHACGMAQPATRRPPQVEGVEGTPQLWRQQLRQRAAFGCLDPHGAEPFLVRERAQSIQQDGLPDPPQPQQYQALGRTSGQQAVHVDGGFGEETVTTGQLSRLETGTGDERIASTIHGGNLAQI